MSTSAIQPAMRVISGSFMPRVVRAGVPMRMPDGSSGWRGSNGIMFLLTVMPAASSACSAILPVTPLRGDVDEHQVIVGAAGDEAEAGRLQLLGQRLGVGDHLRGVRLELRLQRLAEGDRLGGDDVHERPALHAGEDGRVDLLRPIPACTG